MNSDEEMRKMEHEILGFEQKLVEYQQKLADFERMYAEEMQEIITDHEEKILGLEQKITEHYEKMSDYEQIKAEEMQRKVDEYEARIYDYELKRVRYERKIVRLEDALFYKKYEILHAKFTVVEALPELNPPCGGNPFEELVRTAGSLDQYIFHKACREAWAREGKAEDEMQMSAEAVNLYRLWKGLIENGQWQLYPARGLYGHIENSDIEDLREKYGETLYNAIKTAWVEFQELRRTGVTLKPWNHDAGREQTLSELLELLPATIQNLRDGGY